MASTNFFLETVKKIPLWIPLLIAAVIICCVVIAKRQERPKAAARQIYPTLRHEVSRSGPFSSAQAVSLFLPVAVELSNIHRAGSRYRRLSPETILLSGEEARLMRAGETGRSDSFTDLFLAPEFFSGPGTSAASDQYSFFASLGYAVTGKQPYFLHRRKPDSIAFSKNDIEDDGLRAILNKGMSVRPKDRYKSMSEAAFALFGILDPEAAGRGESPFDRYPDRTVI